MKLVELVKVVTVWTNCAGKSERPLEKTEEKW